MFTACALQQLAAAGALRLGDKLVHHIPELAKNPDPRLAAVTLLDVLLNRAGFAREGISNGYTHTGQPFPTATAIIKQAQTSPLILHPKTATKYSNLGFALLGVAIENVTKAPYGDYIKHHIFSKIKQPLFADSKTSAHLAARLSNPQLAVGHSRRLLKEFHPIKNLANRGYGIGLMRQTVPQNQQQRTYIGHSGAHLGFESRTMWCQGTAYIVSVVVNANAAFDTALIQRSVIGLIEKIEKTFGQNLAGRQTRAVQVSEVLASLWGAALYCVGPKQALGFGLNDWNLLLDNSLLDKQGENYVASAIGGIGSVDETVVFYKNKRRITARLFGAHFMAAEPAFQKHLKKVSARPRPRLI